MGNKSWGQGLFIYQQSNPTPTECSKTQTFDYVRSASRTASKSSPPTGTIVALLGLLSCALPPNLSTSELLLLSPPPFSFSLLSASGGIMSLSTEAIKTSSNHSGFSSSHLSQFSSSHPRTCGRIDFQQCGLSLRISALIRSVVPSRNKLCTHSFPVCVEKNVRIYFLFIRNRKTPNTTNHAPLIPDAIR